MKRVLTTLAIFLTAAVAQPAGAWIGVGVGVYAPVAPAPVYYPAYAYPAPLPYYAYPPPVAYPANTYPAYSSAVQPPANCQPYSHVAVIAGQKQTLYGHACQQADGKWRIVD